MALSKQEFDNLISQGLSPEQIIKFESGFIPQKEGVGGIKGFAVGAGKGSLSTARGLSSLGERVITGIGRAVTPKKYEERLGFAKKEKTSAEELITDEMTEAKGGAEKFGKFVEQVAEFAIPATKVSKATKLLSRGQRLGTRALTSAGIATGQEGKIGKETAIAGGLELLLPIGGKVVKQVSKPVTNLVNKLFTNLGSGLSGLSSSQLKNISKNPQIARQADELIKKGGVSSILQSNAKNIMNNVSKLRQTARKAYGNYVGKLDKIKVSQQQIKNDTLEELKKANIKITDKGFDFSNSDIINKNVIKKASNLLDEINKLSKSTGKDVKTVMNKLESSKFKTTGGDPDRLAFNKLMDNVSDGLKKAISKNSPELQKINKQYSTVLDLTKRVENIFGKVKFKNGEELSKISKKLESLDSLSETEQRTISEFFTKSGIDEAQFLTSQGVASSYLKEAGKNQPGFSFAELTRLLTSSIITTREVKNIAIATGLAEELINKIVRNTAPTARVSIIKSILEMNK